VEESYDIKMHCLFCKSDQFELPEEDYQPSNGEMIKCANCGRLNDYEAMCNVAKEHGIELINEEIQKDLKASIKKFKF